MHKNVKIFAGKALNNDGWGCRRTNKGIWIQKLEMKEVYGRRKMWERRVKIIVDLGSFSTYMG